MAQEKAKGSIIFEVLIVVLAVLLIGSIIYPKRVGEREAVNTDLCRSRISSIFDAELLYLRYNKVYTDTLEHVLDFLKNDQLYATYVDSVIKSGLDSIVTKLDEFKAEQQFILAHIPEAIDTVMIDSLGKIQQNIKMQSRRLAGFVEFIHDKMKRVPNTPMEDLRSVFKVVDSKKFTLEMDIIQNSIENGRLEDAELAANKLLETMDDVSDGFRTVLAGLPEFRGASLDSLYRCPTVNKPYKLVHVDTSVVKYLNVYCPVDSVDIEVVESSFLKSTIGGLKIENHGNIEKGVKSWETGR